MKRYLSDIDLSKTEVVETDVAIIGSGIAGLYAAYNLNSSLNCTLFTKQNIDDSSSTLAQGGIAAVTEKDDKFEYHFNDTIKAGAGLCDEKAVQVIVEEGPQDIDELINLGVNFDMDAAGNLLTAQEGGHRMRRILRCGGDATGAEIVEKLTQAVRKLKNISLLKDSFVIDIITEDGEVKGLLILKSGKYIIYKTCHVIIAAGGIGQIYRYTTNPLVATGDGMAMALRAGAKLRHMEFVQFHPTGLYTPENRNKRCFLISEAVRGEGAKLYNDANERFMLGRHEMAELAPRDIVAREIYKEIQHQKSPFVKLDITDESEEFLKKRFPTIYNHCKEKDINIAKQFIPVGPVQHYMMGGIACGLNGETNIKGLYAIGEASSSGVHGANRLASNSTLECVVYGRRSAIHINSNFTRCDCDVTYENPGQKDIEINIEDKMNELKGIMVKHCGILRNEKNLTIGLDFTKELLAELKNAKITSIKLMELYNMAIVANEILKSAHVRKKSVGSHHREDYTDAK